MNENKQLATQALGYSLPLDPLTVAANYFSINSLQLTFELLRPNYPALALNIQNYLANAKLDYGQCAQDKRVELNISANRVNTIISALVIIAEASALKKTYHQDKIITIHQTLLDWLLYAQSFLADIELTRSNKR